MPDRPLPATPLSRDPAPDATDRLLDVHAVALLLGLSPSAVLRLRDRGHLAEVRLRRAIRFRMSDVQRIVREGVPSVSAPAGGAGGAT